MADPDVNVGRDRKVVLMLGVFGRLDFQNVTEWTASQSPNEITIKPVNSAPIVRDLPGIWSGEFSIDRGNAVADKTYGTMEAAYWQGQRMPVGTMFEFLREVDGTESRFQYVGVTISLRNAGSSSADAPIKQTVSWRASQRIVLA